LTKLRSFAYIYIHCTIFLTYFPPMKRRNSLSWLTNGISFLCFRS
jgi:hypothetical protein